MNNEPVAWAREDGVIAFFEKPEVDKQGFKWFPLYTHPVSKAKDRFPNYESICLQCGTTIYKPAFKTLTDEEIEEIYYKDFNHDGEDMLEFARAILKKAQE